MSDSPKDPVLEQILSLRAQVEYHSNRYYNLDDPEISDFEYDKLFQSVDTITGHITSELRKLDVAAAQLPISFNHLKEGLTELQAKATERT